MAIPPHGTPQLTEDDVAWHATRASGPGGQHVNKTASAVELRFDIAASSLPEAIKSRLLGRADRRINRDGVIVLRAQASRSQKRNREAALKRLQAMVDECAQAPVPRRPTRVPAAAKRARLLDKRRRSQTKQLRRRGFDRDG